MTRPLFSFKRIVLAGSLAGLAAAALAQTPPAPAAEPARTHQAREHARPDPAQRQARHEARLKQALQITPAQEPAWNVFTASMLPEPRQADRPDRQALREMTTPQRIERMRSLQAARTAAMERRAEATLRLYAVLTPEQQQRFDQRMAMGPRHGPQPQHRGGPRHEHKG